MKKLLSLLFLIVLFKGQILAQEEPGENSIVDTIIVEGDIFEEDDPLILTLKFDIKAYQRSKNKGKYMPAELRYHLNDSSYILKTIRLKARGNFRRSYCSMPPFWLNIRKADVQNELLQEVTRMKVVTHCKGGNASGIYVLKEFLAYKIYNILSSYSFRVRLINMVYIDTGRKNKRTERVAFIIEPEAMLASRLNAFSIKNDGLSMKHMLPEHMDRMALFQYMIGNGDYSIVGRHNVKIIGKEELLAEGFIPVPYDFDYSGIVNASYAIPGETLGIESVTERYFLGPCRVDEEYSETIEYFNRFRDELLSYLDTFQYLDNSQKAEATAYINEFYSMASMPDFVSKEINSTCR